MQIWHRLVSSIRENPWLSATLLVAFALRLANIGWGIPITPYSNFYHGDEAKAYSSTIQFPEQYLGTESYLYGTAIQYAIGLLLLPVKFVMVGLLGMPAEYALTAIVFFRFCNVVMGTASVYMIYVLGRKLLDERAGLIAAMLLSVALYPAMHSCVTTLDVPMSFLLLGCALTCLKCTETRSAQDFFYAGLVAGMLLGTKVTGFLFVGCAFLWLAVILFTRHNDRRMSVTDRIVLLMVFMISAAGLFSVTTPHVVLDLGEFWEFMMNQKSSWYDKAPTSVIGVLYTWYDATALATGIPVAITSLVGMVLLMKSRPYEALLLVLWVAANYLFWRGYLPARFVIIIVPVLCLMSAVLWSWLLESDDRRVRQGVKALLTIAIASSLVICVLGVTQRWLDARTVASRYIAANVPPESTIGMATDHNENWMHHNWRYPRIDRVLTHFLERPEFVVVTSLELDRMQEALRSDRLLEGNRWDPEFSREWYQDDPPSPEIFTFYQELFGGEAYAQVAQFTAPLRLRIDSAPDVFLFRRESR